MKRPFIALTIGILLGAVGVAVAQFKIPDQRPFGHAGLNRGINYPHTTAVGASLTYGITNAPVTTEVFTFSATATVTLPAAFYPGQVLNAIVCQNATGGFTPSFNSVAALTIIGTFPTFTTTLSKCGDFSLVYTSQTTAYLVGSEAGPL